MNSHLIYTLGAIIISIVMAFKFIIPLPLLLLICSLLNTVVCLCKKKSLHILLLSLVITQMSLFRINNLSYLPLDKESLTSVSLRIEKDSKVLNGLFISSGYLFRVAGEGGESLSSYPVTVYSEKEVFKGEVYSEVLFKNGICKLKKDNKPTINKLYKIRVRLIEFIRRKTESPLLYALLTGDKDVMEEHNRELFRRCGASHILALSGFHLGVIIFLLYKTLSLFIRGNLLIYISWIVLLFYILLVGINPSLTRAFIMYLLGSYNKIKNREVNILQTLILSFYFSVIIFPQDFYTLSFRLSYLALFGILTLGEYISNLPIINRSPVIVKSGLSASIGALLATSLISFFAFGRVYPISVISSLVLTPLITLFMVVGVGSYIFPLLNRLLNGIYFLILKLADFFSGAPEIVINSENSLFITFIFILIPVILFFINFFRSIDVRRFNTQFKLRFSPGD